MADWFLPALGAGLRGASQYLDIRKEREKEREDEEKKRLGLDYTNSVVAGDFQKADALAQQITKMPGVKWDQAQRFLANHAGFKQQKQRLDQDKASNLQKVYMQEEQAGQEQERSALTNEAQIAARKGDWKKYDKITRQIVSIPGTTQDHMLNLDKIFDDQRDFDAEEEKRKNPQQKPLSQSEKISAYEKVHFVKRNDEYIDNSDIDLETGMGKKKTKLVDFERDWQDPKERAEGMFLIQMLGIKYPVPPLDTKNPEGWHPPLRQPPQGPPPLKDGGVINMDDLLPDVPDSTTTAPAAPDSTGLEIPGATAPPDSMGGIAPPTEGMGGMGEMAATGDDSVRVDDPPEDVINAIRTRAQMEIPGATAPPDSMGGIAPPTEGMGGMGEMAATGDDSVRVDDPPEDVINAIRTRAQMEGLTEQDVLASLDPNLRNLAERAYQQMGAMPGAATDTAGTAPPPTATPDSTGLQIPGATAPQPRPHGAISGPQLAQQDSAIAAEARADLGFIPELSASIEPPAPNSVPQELQTQVQATYQVNVNGLPPEVKGALSVLFNDLGLEALVNLPNVWRAIKEGNFKEAGELLSELPHIQQGPPHYRELIGVISRGL